MENALVRHFRKCTNCKRDLPIAVFHLKSNGKDGRDSRCGQCIAKLKSAARKRKALLHKKVDQITTVVVGVLDNEQQNDFAKITALRISALLEKGFLR